MTGDAPPADETGPSGERASEGMDNATPDPSPQLTGTERIFVKMTVWQTVLSLAGVFIAVVALYATIKESAAVRQQTAAAVWPFVQLLLEDFDDGTDAGFTMAFVNAGVGPAKLQGVRLDIGGRPIRNWTEAVAAVGGDPASRMNRNFVSGRVLRPDERVEMLATDQAELARRFQQAVADPASVISYCYCSIFEQCWLADSREDLREPQPVEACPDFGDTGFKN